MRGEARAGGGVGGCIPPEDWNGCKTQKILYICWQWLITRSILPPTQSGTVIEGILFYFIWYDNKVVIWSCHQIDLLVKTRQIIQLGFVIYWWVMSSFDKLSTQLDRQWLNRFDLKTRPLLFPGGPITTNVSWMLWMNKINL